MAEIGERGRHVAEAPSHELGSALLGAELRDKVGAAELLDTPGSLPIDRVVLELMGRAKHVTEIQVVNGLTPGPITKALRGEPVGTAVHA